MEKEEKTLIKLLDEYNKFRGKTDFLGEKVKNSKTEREQKRNYIDYFRMERVTKSIEMEFFMRLEFYKKKEKELSFIMMGEI
jgi:hypothetical protein